MAMREVHRQKTHIHERKREMTSGKKGWFVAMGPKKGKQEPEFFAPLAYGRDDEPYHHMLLMRGRATIFDTIEEAWNEAKKTCIEAKQNGEGWYENYVFSLIEVQL
jgi:hypothetical protein